MNLTCPSLKTFLRKTVIELKEPHCWTLINCRYKESFFELHFSYIKHFFLLSRKGSSRRLRRQSGKRSSYFDLTANPEASNTQRRWPLKEEVPRRCACGRRRFWWRWRWPFWSIRLRPPQSSVIRCPSALSSTSTAAVSTTRASTPALTASARTATTSTVNPSFTPCAGTD